MPYARSFSIAVVQQKRNCPHLVAPVRRARMVIRTQEDSVGFLPCFEAIDQGADEHTVDPFHEVSLQSGISDVRSFICSVDVNEDEVVCGQ